MSEDNMSFLKKCGQLLMANKNNMNLSKKMEEEFKEMLISLAYDRKNTLVVSDNDFGKYVIIEELVNKIAVGDVPNFLVEAIILNIDINEFANKYYNKNDFKIDLKKLINICKENNIIVLLENIELIYDFYKDRFEQSKNLTKENSTLLFDAINNFDLKVIGFLSVEGYTVKFKNKVYDKSFEKISVIAFSVAEILDFYLLKNNIGFKDDTIKLKVIDELVNISEMVDKENINNYALILSIIDRAFAFVKASDSCLISINDFIASIRGEEDIDSVLKENVISKLNYIDNNLAKNKKSGLLKMLKKNRNYN